MLDLDRNMLRRPLSGKAAAHLRSFAEAIAAALGAPLDDILLFGSRARGDAKASSDYDVAVIIPDSMVSRRLNHLVADLAYPHILSGIHIRPVIVGKSKLAGSGSSGLGLTLRHEGISILR